jgi:hypothetical protein
MLVFSIKLFNGLVTSPFLNTVLRPCMPWSWLYSNFILGLFPRLDTLATHCFCFSFLCHTVVCTQGHAFAKQALHHISHAPIPCYFSLFLRLDLSFVWASLWPQFSYLSFLSSWDYRCESPYLATTLIFFQLLDTSKAYLFQGLSTYCSQRSMSLLNLLLGLTLHSFNSISTPPPQLTASSKADLIPYPNPLFFLVLAFTSTCNYLSFPLKIHYTEKEPSAAASQAWKQSLARIRHPNHALAVCRK